MPANASASGRPYETKTLHFDLSHAPAGVQHTLQVGGKTYPLTAHTPDTMAAHAAANPVLARIPAAQSSLSHYAENVPLPSNASIILRVNHPSKDPNSPLPAMSLLTLHIPTAARQQAMQLNPTAHATMAAKKMAVLGAAPAPAASDADDSGSDGDSDSDYLNSFQTPLDAAQALVGFHPDLVSLDPTTAAHIQNTHIANAPGIDDLATSISEQGPADVDGGWAVIAPCLDPSGNQINDSSGNPAYRYKLSEQTRAAMGTPGRAALRTSKDDTTLKDKTWTQNYGSTSIDHSAVTPASASLAHPAALATAPQPPTQSDTAPFTAKDWTSMWGMSFDRSSVTIGTDGSFSMKVTNTALRHVTVSREMLDDQGNSLSNDNEFQIIYPGNVFMGVPLPTESTTVSFTFDQKASAVRLHFGTFGYAPCDGDRCKIAIVMTSLFEFAIPMTLLVVGTLVKDTESYQQLMGNKEVITAVAAVAAFLITPAFIYEIVKDPVKGLIMVADTLGPMLVGAVPALMVYINTQLAEGALTDAIPIVGVICEAICIAASLAQICETTASVGATPFVTSIDVVRTMNLTVNVGPDPEHAMWPSTNHYWRIMVQYKGGTFQHAGGNMSDVTGGVTSAATLTQTFKGVPAGGQLMVYAVIYSANWWICGYVASDWIDALPVAGANSTDLPTLTVNLNIKEQLVPLTADTTYSHLERVVYGANGHQWQACAAPTEVVTALHDDDTGNNLAELGGITINDRAHMLGYSWRASGQGLPLAGSSSTAPVNGQLYAFQNISYLASPESALKSTHVGWSNPQRILYDQFAPLDTNGTGNGSNFYLDSCADGIHLRSVVLDNTTQFDMSGAHSWGKFTQTALDAAIVHPAGYAVAVNWKNSKMEILSIPSSPSSDDLAPTANPVSGEGVREGLMQGPTALAVTPTGEILVLETKNARVQAFDTRGNATRIFADPSIPRSKVSTMALKAQSSTVTYLDMGTESKGYVFVLYYLGAGTDPSNYHLDIYDPEGNYLSTTNGLNAAKMVVGMWRDVYALNYQVLLGPGNRTEPSVSHWIPSTPPGTQPS